MQTVKYLGTNASRELKTIKSKNRVCLLHGGRSENLETFIQNEYFTPLGIGINLSLSTIESNDSLLANAGVIASGSLIETDTNDVVNISVVHVINSILSISENDDIVLTIINNIANADLSIMDDMDFIYSQILTLGMIYSLFNYRRRFKKHSRQHKTI